MSLKVGFVGPPGRIAGSAFMDTAPLLSAVGQNTGNLVFQYAVRTTIAEEHIFVGSDLPWNPAKVRQHCKVLVIPSANFLREGFDPTGFINFLDKVELPLVFLGLGAQADSFEKTEFNFEPSILRLIDLLRERSKIVGVRGNYTAELLHRHSVDNVAVIGCPSNFLNSDPELPSKLERKWSEKVVTIATTGDEAWPRNIMKRDAERRLVAIARENGGIYVHQSVEPLVKSLRARNPYQTSPVAPNTVESLRNSIAPHLSDDDFTRFLASAVRIYYDVDQWLEDLARFDLSIGLRLHGNMVPFQAGCPAIWIHHDARTRELVETMRLPNLALPKFLSLRTVDEMKKASGADFAAYGMRRLELRRRYHDIFDAHGIAHIA
jgi:hypothetical protein